MGGPSLALARDERAQATEPALGTDPKTGTGTDPRNGPYDRYHPQAVLLNPTFACGAGSVIGGDASEIVDWDGAVKYNPPSTVYVVQYGFPVLFPPRWLLSRTRRVVILAHQRYQYRCFCDNADCSLHEAFTLLTPFPPHLSA